MFVSGRVIGNHHLGLRFVDEELSNQTSQPPVAGMWGRAKAALRRLTMTSKTPFLALFDQAVMSGANLLTAIIVARFCGDEGLGLFTLGMSMVLLANSVQGSLITTPYTVFLRRQEASDHPLRHAGNALLGFCLLVSLLALLGIGVAWGCHMLPGIRVEPSLVWVIVVLIPCFLLRDFARRFEFAHMRMGGALLVDVGVATAQLLSLLILGLQGRLSASVALATVAISCAALGLVWLVMRRRAFQFGGRRQLAVAMWRDWIFGRWLMVDQLIAVGQINATYWLLALFINPAATGTLAACSTIAGLPNPLLFGVGNYLAPRFADTVARGAYADTMRVYRRSLLGLGTAISVFTVIAMIFGNDLLWLFYQDPAYHGLGLVVGLLALRLMLAVPTISANHAIIAMEGPRGSAFASLLGLLATLITAIPVISMYGVMGAAIALFIGVSVECIFTLVVFVRYLRSWKWSDGTSRSSAGSDETSENLP